MNNTECVILISTKRGRTWKYRRDTDGWMQSGPTGKVHRLTAEQLLSHILPPLAGLSPVVVRVEPVATDRRHSLPAGGSHKRSPCRIEEDPTERMKRSTGRFGKWRPASPDWVTVFSTASAGLGEQRRMFGYPCAFVNGNMFAGLFQTGMFVRLSELERQVLLGLKGSTRFEPLPGRVMREYVTVPANMVEQPRLATEWVRRAFAYASSLPAKHKKTRRRPRRP